MANVNSQAKYARALELLRQGNFALAEAGFLEIVESSQKHFDAIYMLATLNAQRGNWVGALGYLDRALAIDKRNAAANNLRGRILLDTGKPEDALKFFDRAIANKRDFAEAFDNRGKALQDLNRPIEALESFSRAIRLNSNFADAYNNRGIVFNQLGRDEEALADFNAAIALDAGFVQAHGNRGNVLKKLGNPEAALESFDNAVALDPQSALTHSNRGAVLCDLNREAEAMEAFDRAIAIDSSNAEAFYNRGNVLSGLRRWADALASYDRAIELNPAFADAFNNRGTVYCELDQFDEALTSVAAAIALRPDSFRAHINLGNVFRLLGRFAEALECSDRAVSLSGSSAGVWSSRALILKDLDRLDEALQSADKAVQLHAINGGSQRELAEAHNSRGSVLHDLNRDGEALACYERAISLHHDFPAAHNNRGLAFMELGQIEEALQCFAIAETLKPEFAEARYNEGICHLLKGDYALGWKGFEYRRVQQDRTDLPLLNNFESSVWDGEYLEGTLLVWEEHGLGDQILYASMLGELAGRCANLVVRVEPRLVGLFSRSFPDVTIISSREPMDRVKYDRQVPIGSIARHFRNSLSGFHSQPRGYLKVEKARSRRLRETLAAEGKLVCGLSWFSKRKLLGENKSIPLEDLVPVLEIPGIEFVDLQYGDTDLDRKSLLRTSGCRLRHLDEIDALDDIDGLAALIDACDVVVTVSNTTAHLAGALGKETLLMLPHSRGTFWYWGAQGETPWYPSIRSFRQTYAGNWGDVVKNVQIALKSDSGSDSRKRGI
jgi:tetratricopeptide (TPR) repeat protein